MPEKTDEQLFRLYVEGDQSAFDELHRRYQPMLVRYVSQKTHRDKTTCEEIVQLTFVRVFQNKHRFIDGKLFRPWVFTIADRLSKDWMKSLKRRGKYILCFTDHDVRDQGGHILDGHQHFEAAEDSRVEPPADSLERQEEGRRAMALLSRLPPKLRLAVELLVLNESPGRAAGPLMKISYVQAQTRRRMAVDILRKQLEEDSPVPEADAENLGMGATIRDLIRSMPDEDREAFERAVFYNSGDRCDVSVFARFMRRLVGESITSDTQMA